MKKQLLGLMTILTALGACQKNEVTSLSEDVTVHATIEEKDATRTVMDENNNILWSDNDQIIAFMKSSYGYKYQVKPAFVGKSYADFSMVSSGNGSDLSAGNEWEHNVVYYPYSEDIECLKSGANYALEVNLPSEQVYVPDSFANGSMAMVAVSENNNITFNNVLGGIKLQLKGSQTVKSIKIEGKNNEKLSGATVVTAYTDGTKPAITMASSSSTSVCLNCGSGVQLNETAPTEFIIALPPVFFSKGFTLTVTDSESKTYTVETDKANTVLRSSLLVMPAFKLGNAPIEEDPDEDDELIIPVSFIKLDLTSLKLYVGDIAQLTATVGPNDATNKTVIWSSETPSVATVDQKGFVTGVSAGTTKISAASGGKVATCTVIVSSLAVASTDYVDEYGVNHGKGIAIGNAVWAPVNCGYHKDDYKYGKLYQWGRKYGQGYDDSDAVVPNFEEGGVTVVTGNHKSKSNVFYTSTSTYNYDWIYPQDDNLWNSGSDSNPVKAEYDPCPSGWRVPTYDEANELCLNHSNWTTDEKGQAGYWFSGAMTYSSDEPQVFFSAAGMRRFDTTTFFREACGSYWSSGPSVKYLSFDSVGNASMKDGTRRANAYSVRCVQE